jgi:hypothetical protein
MPLGAYGRRPLSDTYYEWYVGGDAWSEDPLCASLVDRSLVESWTRILREANWVDPANISTRAIEVVR